MTHDTVDHLEGVLATDRATREAQLESDRLARVGHQKAFFLDLDERVDSLREARDDGLRKLHDVLNHHGRIRAEHLERFERATELQAVAMLLQAETLGTTTGEVEVLVKRLGQKLRERGVLP